MSYNLLPTDVLFMIIEYIPSIDDIYKVTTVEELSESKLQRLARLLQERIDKRLFQIGFDQEFFTALQKNKGVISGSFILETLLGENRNEDIDIFIVGDCSRGSGPHPNCDGTAECCKLFSPIERYLWLKCAGKDKNYSYDDYSHLKKFGIDIVRAYKIGNSKVQVINVINKEKIDDYECVCNFIKNCFDFSFCMNTYDGKELYIHDQEAIRDRKCENKFITKDYDFHVMKLEGLKPWIGSIHYRCLKYINRGFTIVNYEMPEILIMDCNKNEQLVHKDKIIWYLDKLKIKPVVKFVSFDHW